jgi:hypothetical protein
MTAASNTSGRSDFKPLVRLRGSLVLGLVSALLSKASLALLTLLALYAGYFGEIGPVIHRLAWIDLGLFSIASAIACLPAIRVLKRSKVDLTSLALTALFLVLLWLTIDIASLPLRTALVSMLDGSIRTI